MLSSIEIIFQSDIYSYLRCHYQLVYCIMAAFLSMLVYIVMQSPKYLKRINTWCPFLPILAALKYVAFCA
ncbi:hypothetical protein BX600DRAFT_477231, partial [Xylariales sp. PMI_506]